MGKSGKKKHPDAPKSAMGAYMWFCQDKREYVKTTQPNLAAKEILSALGKLWREMTEEDKVKYNEQANLDKQRFEGQKTEFLKTHDSLFVDDPSSGRRKKKKDPNAPKRPRSAYILFTQDRRAEVTAEVKAENGKQTEVMSRLAKLWKEASVDTKEKYHKVAEGEKADYEEARKRYDEGLAQGVQHMGDGGDESE